MKNRLFSLFHVNPLLFFPSWQIRFSASMCLICSTMQSVVRVTHKYYQQLVENMIS